MKKIGEVKLSHKLKNGDTVFKFNKVSKKYVKELYQLGIDLINSDKITAKDLLYQGSLKTYKKEFTNLLAATVIVYTIKCYLNRQETGINTNVGFEKIKKNKTTKKRKVDKRTTKIAPKRKKTV